MSQLVARSEQVTPDRVPQPRVPATQATPASVPQHTPVDPTAVPWQRLIDAQLSAATYLRALFLLVMAGIVGSVAAALALLRTGRALQKTCDAGRIR